MYSEPVSRQKVCHILLYLKKLNSLYAGAEINVDHIWTIIDRIEQWIQSFSKYESDETAILWSVKWRKCKWRKEETPDPQNSHRHATTESMISNNDKVYEIAPGENQPTKLIIFI